MAGSPFIKAIPGEHRAQVANIAHAAATATEYICLWAAPFACRLLGVYWVPAADVTGTATNYTNLNVINRGSAGAGSTELGNKDYASGTDAVGGDVNTIVAGLTTALAENDVIGIQAEKVSTGLALPAGTFIFLYDGGGALA